jgi:DNA repair protein RadC
MRSKILSSRDALPLFSRSASFRFVALSKKQTAFVVRDFPPEGVRDTPLLARKILIEALRSRATAFIVGRRSEERRPLPTDARLFARLDFAGSLLGLPLIDYLVVDDEGYYSFGLGERTTFEVSRLSSE